MRSIWPFLIPSNWMDKNKDICYSHYEKINTKILLEVLIFYLQNATINQTSATGLIYLMEVITSTYFIFFLIRTSTYLQHMLPRRNPSRRIQVCFHNTHWWIIHSSASTKLLLFIETPQNGSQCSESDTLQCQSIYSSCHWKNLSVWRPHVA